MSKRTIAIGDIHGCYGALAGLLQTISLEPDDTIITLGDYTSRGDDIAGVDEERPAVLPVNMLFASLAVNEFLARVHDYRHEPNGNYARLMLSLEQVQFYPEQDGEPCSTLARHVGRGDVVPLLDRPTLSER